MTLRLHRGAGMLAGYDYDSVLPRLRKLAPDEAFVTLRESDVAAYRVSRSGTVELVLDEAATKRVAGGRPLTDACGEGPFVVLFDEELLYGGQCYPAMGAAALAYPVIHTDDDHGRLVLRVAPAQGSWDPGDRESTARIDPPVLRARFERLGRFEELP